MIQPELFSQVIGLSQTIVAGVDDSVLDQPTPCAEWNVLQLINHMAITLRFAGAVMDGRTPHEDRLASNDVLGTNWRNGYTLATTSAVTSFQTKGAMERQVDAPPGNVPGSFWVSFPTWDIYVHSWDLAQATGQTVDWPDDYTRPIRAWVEQVFGPPHDSEEFGAIVEVPADASDMGRLVAQFGRTP